MLIQRLDRENLSPAYGGALCQGVQPWAGKTSPPFFTTWVILEPGQKARSHKHQEHEAFVITRGRGLMRLDDETAEVTAGDVVFIEPWSHHELTNLDDQDELHFIDLCWEKMDEAVEINEEVLAAEVAASQSADHRTLLTVASTAASPAAEVHARYLKQRGVEASLVPAASENPEKVIQQLLERGTVIATEDGFSLPLEDLQSPLAAHLAETRMSARQRVCCEAALASQAAALMISRPELETAVACLASAEGQSLNNWTVVFDVEQARACGIVLPALCLAQGSGGPRPTALIDLDESLDTESINTSTWDDWFNDLQRRVADGFDGTLPSTGAWTDGQQRFFEALGRIQREVADVYEPGAYSPSQAHRSLQELADRTRGFAAAESHWKDLPGRYEEWRTTIALEALAAKTLARLASPLLPNYGARLWNELGFTGEVAWEDPLVFVPGGRSFAG